MQVHNIIHIIFKVSIWPLYALIFIFFIFFNYITSLKTTIVDHCAVKYVQGQSINKIIKKQISNIKQEQQPHNKSTMIKRGN